MELKAGMPVWAKETHQDFTKGEKYVVIEFNTNQGMEFYVFDDIGDIFAIDSDYASEHFTTTPPKEQAEEDFARTSNKGSGDEPPVFKSLEELKGIVAIERGHKDWIDWQINEPDEDISTMDCLKIVSERHSAQYREAYEAEKAENQRLKAEIEKLKNRNLNNVKKAIEDARISSYDPTKGIEFIYSYEDIIQSLDLETDKTK